MVSKNNIDASGDDYHLSIQGYEFDLNREIEGSVKYINKKLAPEKKQTRVFLWTGDALAGKRGAGSDAFPWVREYERRRCGFDPR